MVARIFCKAWQSVGIALMLLFAGSHASAQSDPPGRVARLNYFNGEVAYALAGSDDWVHAELNRPLTTGDRIWSTPGSRSELHIGSTVLRLGSQTSIEFLKIDDSNAQIKVAQGTASLHIRQLPGDQSVEIDTPNVAFVIQEAGDYRINVGADGQSTGITIWQGRGIAYGDTNSLVLQGRQQARFVGTSLSQIGGNDAPVYDEFDTWAQNRDQAEDAVMSSRYVSREMVGYEQLDTYGTWRQTPQYGAVWVPYILAVGWAPYRAGHWAWVEPWGWTWIDNMPWGFAPYHYGRWAYLGNTWCWVPGVTAVRAVPVYAPALVAYVGVSRVSPGIGWFPLGPGEIYRPGYRASQRYIANVNKTVVINNSAVNYTTINNLTKTVYINQHVPNAVTATSIAAFTHGQAVAAAMQSVKREHLEALQVLGHAAPISPVRESMLGAARPAANSPTTITMRRKVLTTDLPSISARRHELRERELKQPQANERMGYVPKATLNAQPALASPSGKPGDGPRHQEPKREMMKGEPSTSAPTVSGTLPHSPVTFTASQRVAIPAHQEGMKYSNGATPVITAPANSMRPAAQVPRQTVNAPMPTVTERNHIEAPKNSHEVSGGNMHDRVSVTGAGQSTTSVGPRHAENDSGHKYLPAESSAHDKEISHHNETRQSVSKNEIAPNSGKVMPSQERHEDHAHHRTEHD